MQTALVTAAERFQMALFNSDDPTLSDLGFFEPNEHQPPGVVLHVSANLGYLHHALIRSTRRSVFYIPPPAVSDTVSNDGWVEKYNGRPEAEWPAVDQEVRAAVAALLQLKPHDWTRIDAVLVDEPFLGAATCPEQGDCINPCSNDELIERPERYERMRMVQRVLVNVAAVVRDWPNAQKTRFWVNFSEPEMEWMESNLCDPLRLNDWYMDVVSLDIYDKEFADIKLHYDYLVNNPPTAYQQLALVPGTYSTSSDPASAVAARLQGFFHYAHTMNQSCSLPIGRVGVTRSADGCPIWLVAGFWGADRVISERAPLAHPASADIRSAWKAQFDIPHRNALMGNAEVFDILNGVISGWAVDRTAPDLAPQVDIWLDGTTYLGGVVPTQQRTDVETYTGISSAGYTFTIPPDYRQLPGCHEYVAYAVARAPAIGTVELGSKSHCE